MNRVPFTKIEASERFHFYIDNNEKPSVEGRILNFTRDGLINNLRVGKVVPGGIATK